MTLFPPELIKAPCGATPPAHERTRPPDLTQSTRTVLKSHGRIETRQLAVSCDCVAHLGWPGDAQVCRIERTREKAGKISHEIAYAVTSLPPEQADPDTLLTLWRDHWLIENRLHWRRDVTLREDLSSIRTGTGPRAIAALRNTMLAIVHDLAEPLTETREIFAENRSKAVEAAVKGVL